MMANGKEESEDQYNGLETLSSLFDREGILSWNKYTLYCNEIYLGITEIYTCIKIYLLLSVNAFMIVKK